MTAARMLRYARRSVGMTQRALAKATGLPQSSIARIERGTNVPRVDTLQRLLRATGNELEALPLLGEGIDRSLIRMTLAMTPDERGRAAARAGSSLANLRAQARVHDRSPRG